MGLCYACEGNTGEQMALLQIRKYPDPVLKQPAQPVTQIDGELHSFIESMVQTMYAAPGIGLAAPQVGDSRRIIVIDADQGNPGRRLLKLINPQVTEMDGKLIWEEACLSVIDYSAQVQRARHIVVKAITPEENEVEIEAEEFLAVVFQHELDHLDGKLFIDRVSRLKRQLYRRKLQKLIREGKIEDHALADVQA
jgi:peptide deformylase